MNDLDELTEYLHARADAADLGHTPLGLITRAGARRRNRHRAVTTAGVLAVGTLGTVATVLAVAGSDSPGRIRTDSLDTAPGPPVPTDPPDTTSDMTASTTAATAPETASSIVTVPTFAESPLVWNPVTVGSAESITMFDQFNGSAFTMRGPDGELYQSATAPGRGSGRVSMLYRSVDGITWTPEPSRMFEERLAPLAIDGERFYTVSTTAAGAPAAMDATDYAAVSTDGGASWSTTPLPYDLGAVVAAPGVDQAHVLQRAAAANGTGAVLAEQVLAYVTVESAAAALGLDPLALDVRRDRPGFIEYATTEIGCETILQGPDGEPPAARGRMDTAGGRCVAWGDVVHEYTWDDLGLVGDAATALNGQLVLFRAPAGTTTFTRIQPPDALAMGGVDGIGLAADADRFLLTALWRPDPSTPQIAKVFVSDDGTDWEPLPDPPGDGCSLEGGFVNGAPVIDLRSCGRASQVFTFRDGAWVAADFSAPDGLAPTGWSWSDVGPAGVAVAMEVGTPRSTTGGVGNPSDPEPGSRRWLLFYSPDGVTWSKVDLADLVDDVSSKTVTSVRVTDTNVIVSMRQRLDLIAADDPLPDVTVLVGTLE